MGRKKKPVIKSPETRFKTIVPKEFFEFDPEMFVNWIRGYDEIDYKKPLLFMNLGKRGSGKSALIEFIAVMYLLTHSTGKLKSLVVDIFGSRDNEALSWLRSPWRDECLVIHGDSMKISVPCDSVSISNLKYSHFNSGKYRVIITCPVLYSSRGELYESLDKIVRLFEKRWFYTVPWFLLIRESANFIGSRYNIVKNQHQAKAEFVHFVREARHCGIAIGIDALKPTSVEVDVRMLADFTFIKRLGKDGLKYADELRWIYSIIDPASMADFPPERFVIVSDNGALGIGETNYVPWHKETYQNIVEMVELKFQEDEIPDYGTKGKRGRTSDFDHDDIIQTKFEHPDWSNKAIGESLNIPRTEGTVRSQVNQHNREVEKKSYCLRCRRVMGEHQNDLI